MIVSDNGEGVGVKFHLVIRAVVDYIANSPLGGGGGGGGSGLSRG